MRATISWIGRYDIQIKNIKLNGEIIEMVQLEFGEFLMREFQERGWMLLHSKRADTIARL